MKSHAVTLYEAGKLGHASIADLCKDLSSLEGTKFEGELQEFANHAFSLRCVLECLHSGGVVTDVKAGEVCDKMDMLASSNDESTLIANITLTEKAGNSETNEPMWDKDDLASSGMPPEGSILAEYATEVLVMNCFLLLYPKKIITWVRYLNQIQLSIMMRK